MTNLSRRQLLKYAALGSSTLLLPGCITQAILSERINYWHKYRSSLVIDGLSGAFEVTQPSISTQDLETIRSSGVTAVNATIPYPGDNFALTEQKIEQTLAIIDKYHDYFQLITSTTDLLNAKKTDKVGIIMGFQSTEMFEDDISRIDYFAKRGVRYMQLTYNRASQFGEGGLSDTNNGLSALGLDALAAMEQSNVLVDLSHSNKATVAQAIAVSSKPLTISHTGCNALYSHPRNNDDSELKAVADKGGVVGIYLMPFLDNEPGDVKAASFMKHLTHAINVCGEDHVAIGSDQGILPIDDGPEYREMIRQAVKRRKAAGISAPGESADKPPFIPELNAPNKMERIAWHMTKQGYNDTQIEKVLGRNLANLYQQVW